MVSLDDLKDVDYQPLLDLLTEIDTSEIEAVDMINRCSCVLNGERVLLLLRAIHEKLRVVDLQDMILGKNFLLYVLLYFFILLAYIINIIIKFAFYFDSKSHVLLE